MPKKKSKKNLNSDPALKKYPVNPWFFLPAIFLLLFMSLYFLGDVFKNQNKSLENISTQPKKLQSLASSSTKISSASAKPVPQVVPITPQVNGPGIPILTYHYIAYNPVKTDLARDSLEVTPDKFEAQMDYLSKNGYMPISLDTLYGIFGKQITPPAKPVVLTFDDGYIDFYTNAYPILRRFGFHAVSFIPTGLIGKNYYMNWDQIREIQAFGLVTFEAHSVSHSNLTSLSFDGALKEMLDSKNFLFSNTGYPVNFIAYPYGITNESVQAAAQKAGFVGGLGTWFGRATGSSMNMPRIKVSGAWSIKEFAARL